MNAFLGKENIIEAVYLTISDKYPSYMSYFQKNLKFIHGW